ncbi:asparagine synthase (glutamine-hydrolyzing) [Magnetospirillum sp. UT-4]|uniref:asparagine synthase (glutamine-hydrolyzing) n=1 Tax=Magnetospirillum sp. UT-4 TaxID=2681467 RepID=UPI00138144FB|nr:asparagine synthase (glutamine-hydrolyzing) [Magnetospirillum sp. UT-4]CAA7612125.1 Asparagine synthetase [Magnetospirillum sp. UT-4]
MCGIAGEFRPSRSADTGAVRAMMDLLGHRGPDAEGLVGLGPVALGHRRLAVIDTSVASNQPMLHRDGRCAIVFNGEIYNYRDLRRDLEALGARFRTEGDTEVILEAYRQHGPACVSHLNGMFAFALWDAGRGELLLARDRLGKKPLFYAPLAEGGLAFASELPALLAHPGVRTGLSGAGLMQFLCFGYTVGEDTLVEGVRKLAAGHTLVVSRNGIGTPRRYWHLADAFRNKFRGGFEDAKAALNALIDDAVRIRLTADVGVGIFLSGGMDSAVVAAATARVAGAQAHQAFCMGFPEPGFSEAQEARASASFLDIPLQIEQPERLDDLVIAALEGCGEPLADTSVVPTWALSRAARRSVTVALSGDGGDELFAGYDTYRAGRLHAALARFPVPLRRALAGFGGLLPHRMEKVGWDEKLRRFLAQLPERPERAHALWRVVFDPRRMFLRAPPADCDPVLAALPTAEDTHGLDPLDRALFADINTWLVDDILVKVDRASMANSLEVRSPLLDHRVVEFAASLPPEWKLRGFTGKHILRQAQKPFLPPHVLAGRKKGFNAPASHWLRGPLAAAGRDITLSKAMTDLFHHDRIELMWHEHLAGSRDNGYMLFALLGLGLFLQKLHTR